MSKSSPDDITNHNLKMILHARTLVDAMEDKHTPSLSGLGE